LGAAPLNVALARGVRMPPNPEELVVLGPAERFADGGLAARLRITNELREVTYLDHVRLLAVDHPPDATIFSRDRVVARTENQRAQAEEGASSRVRNPGYPLGAAIRNRIVAGRNPVAVRSAVGSDGVDRTAALARADGVFADPGSVIPPPVVGFIEPLSIEFDFGEVRDAGDLLLAMTGWFRFGDSSANIAASQRNNLAVIWPKLEALGDDGQWHLVDDAIGFPAGKTKTIVCDLRGKLPPQVAAMPTLKFRLTSSFEVRWDNFSLYQAVPNEELQVAEIGPAAANLDWHGFAAMSTPGDNQPATPDLSRISDRPPWFTTLEGWCTRYGGIDPLLAAADRRLAILNAGDGATIDFRSNALPDRRPGAARTLLLFTHGWVKEGDANGTMELTVAPLPGSEQDGQTSPAGDAADWQREFNIRWVPRDRFAPIR
jgi:hypothetical protein